MRKITSIILLWVTIGLITSCSTGNNTKMYNVNISITPSGEGTVQPSTDSTYEEGTTITLKATGSAAYQFSKWAGDLGATDNPHQLTVNQDYNISAQFEKKQYKLTVNKNGDGTVQESVVQGKTYGHGTVVELKATPGTAYQFKNWSGDLNSSDNPKTIVMDGPKTVTANFEVKPTKAAFKIKVDWNKLSVSSNKVRYKSIGDSVTDFGARLVYPNQNAVFLQSVTKQTADSSGLITMEVPPADSARLLVAAVRHESGNDKVLGLGILEDLTIQQGKSYEWNVDDITWTEPYWKPADSLANDYNSGEFTVSKDKQQFDFYFLVRDPYYPKPDPPLNSYLIRLNGYGGNTDYQNGFRVMRQIAENPSVGTANQKKYDNFYPYLKSEMFQLPDGRYVVYKKGSFTVNWQ